MGAKPPRGQLNRKHEYFPVPVRALEYGLAIHVWPSRPASACSFSTLRLNLVLTRGIPSAFRDGVHIYIPPTAIGSVPTLSGHAQLRTNGVHYRESIDTGLEVLKLVLERSDVVASSSFHHGPFFYMSLLSHTHLLMISV